MILSGSRVLITGASSGIGFEVARQLVAAGARVFITGLPPESDVRDAALRISSDSTRIGYAVMDLLDENSVQTTVKAAGDFLGGIDILINNAGIAGQAPVTDLDLASAEREISINYLGMVRVTKAVLPQMIHNRRGTIVNVASTLAKVPGPTQANYSASKAAIVAFSSALRSEVEDQGVAVKVFIPGLTATPLTDSLNVRTPSLLTPQEVGAHMLKALQGRRAEYVTGATYRALVLANRFMPETSRRMLKRYY